MDIVEKELEAARKESEKIVLEIRLECQSKVEALREAVSTGLLPLE